MDEAASQEVSPFSLKVWQPWGFHLIYNFTVTLHIFRKWPMRQNFKRKADPPACNHRDAVEGICSIPSVNCYATCGRDGTVQ